jgi:hypothetical protein
MLSSADNVPLTFAKHNRTPSTSASITLPAGGASVNPHNLTHCAIQNPPMPMFERSKRFIGARQMLKSIQKLTHAPSHSEANHETFARQSSV